MNTLVHTANAHNSTFLFLWDHYGPFFFFFFSPVIIAVLFLWLRDPEVFWGLHFFNSSIIKSLGAPIDFISWLQIIWLTLNKKKLSLHVCDVFIKKMHLRNKKHHTETSTVKFLIYACTYTHTIWDFAVTAHERGREELPGAQGQGRWPRGATLIRGKEQRLHFAGAAVKRDPTSKVRETQVRR